MNIFRLLQIHLELGCVTFDHRGDLIHLPCPDSDPLPRVYIGHHPQGYITLFHHDVPPNVREEISALPAAAAFTEPEQFARILGQDASCRKIASRKSYIFQQRISPEFYPDVTRVDNIHSRLFSDAGSIAQQSVFAILRRDEFLSVCESARENKHAGEAWVQTEPDARRHGYARQTTFAWAHDLQQRKKIPFLTHAVDDSAVEGLAASLDAGHWITEISFA